MKTPRDRAFERRVSKKLKKELKRSGAGFFERWRIRHRSSTHIQSDAVLSVFFPFVAMMAASFVFSFAPKCVFSIFFPSFSLVYALWWAGSLSGEAVLSPGNLLLSHYPVSPERYWSMVVPSASRRFFRHQTMLFLVALIFGGANYVGFPAFLLIGILFSSALFALSLWACFRFPRAPYRRVSLLLLASVALLFYAMVGGGGAGSFAESALSPFLSGSEWLCSAVSSRPATVLSVLAAASAAAVCAAVLVYRRERWWYYVEMPLYYDLLAYDDVDEASSDSVWDGMPDSYEGGSSSEGVFGSLADSVGGELSGRVSPSGFSAALLGDALGKRGETVLDFLSAGEWGRGSVLGVPWRLHMVVMCLFLAGAFVWEPLGVMGGLALAFSGLSIFYHGFPGPTPVPNGNVSVPFVAFFPVSMRDVAWIHLKLAWGKFLLWLPSGYVLSVVGVHTFMPGWREAALTAALIVAIFAAALPLLASLEIMSVKRGYKSFVGGFFYSFSVITVICVEASLVCSMLILENWMWSVAVVAILAVLSFGYFALCASCLWDRTLTDFVHPIQRTGS